MSALSLLTPSWSPPQCCISQSMMYFWGGGLRIHKDHTKWVPNKTYISLLAAFSNKLSKKRKSSIVYWFYWSRLSHWSCTAPFFEWSAISFACSQIAHLCQVQKFLKKPISFFGWRCFHNNLIFGPAISPFHHSLWMLPQLLANFKRTCARTVNCAPEQTRLAALAAKAAWQKDTLHFSNPLAVISCE